MPPSDVETSEGNSFVGLAVASEKETDVDSIAQTLPATISEEDRPSGRPAARWALTPKALEYLEEPLLSDKGREAAELSLKNPQLPLLGTVHNVVSTSLRTRIRENRRNHLQQGPSVIKKFFAEAETLLRAHPRMPHGWEDNIPAFLFKCYKQVPYISSWAWAIKTFEMGWCRWAPFKYFQWVLMNPQKYKITGSNAHFTPYQVMDWLKGTKGWRAAYAYGKKMGIIKPNPVTQERHETALRVNKWAAERLKRPPPKPDMSIEEFEEEMAFRKKLQGQEYEGLTDHISFRATLDGLQP